MNNIKPNKDELISKLSSYFKQKADSYQLDLAFLFGSYARGQLKKESDIDVAVVFTNAIDTEKRKFELATNIAVDLSSELKTEVDVIVIDDIFSKPMLSYNAVVLGVPVYVGNKTRYIQIYNQSLFQMNDFEIFGSRLQFEAARNTLKGVSHG